MAFGSTSNLVRSVTALGAVALGVACGAESNSEIAALGCGNASGTTTPGSGNTTSTPGKSTGSGGSGGSSSTPKPGSGGSSTSGAGAGGQSTTPGDACGVTSFTEAIHIVMEVTWAGTSSRQAGSGQVHTWNRLKLSAQGNDISGKMRPCGTILPPTQLSALAGGKKVLIELPDSIWDAAEMPEFDVKGTQSAPDANSNVKMNWISTVGVTLGDPAGAWPKASGDLETTQDVDGDAKSGYSAVPRDGGEYTLPPTSLGAALGGPWADRVYLVSRHIIGIDGTRSACDRAEGVATVDAFDSHVVGCRLKGGDKDCDEAQTKFVDENRMVYTVKSATFSTQRVADGASCADVRAALP